MGSIALDRAIAMDTRNREAAGVVPDRLDVAAARASLCDLGMRLPAKHEELSVRGAGPAATWLGAPDNRGGPRIVYLHGGGFVAGNLDSHRGLVAWLAHKAEGYVLFVDYTLAPEGRFPLQLDQANAALEWAAVNGPDGPGGASQLVLAGDSAGACLAVGVLLMRKARCLHTVDAAVLFCGMLDLDERTSAFAGSSQRMREMIRAYLRTDADLDDPLANPMRANLAGLPPMLLQTGTADPCMPDLQSFAKRAVAAEVDVKLTGWADMIHVWQRFAPQLPEASAALTEAGQFIRRRTA